jgi:hypothetical protein
VHRAAGHLSQNVCRIEAPGLTSPEGLASLESIDRYVLLEALVRAQTIYSEVASSRLAERRQTSDALPRRWGWFSGSSLFVTRSIVGFTLGKGTFCQLQFFISPSPPQPGQCPAQRCHNAPARMTSCRWGTRSKTKARATKATLTAAITTITIITTEEYLVRDGAVGSSVRPWALAILFRREVLRELVDLWRESVTGEKKLLKGLNELVALGNVLPLLFQV